MRILIAPDKFKGSLGAQEVAENIAAGLREVLPDAQIDQVPMADGGEGTAEVISNALGAVLVECPAHDSLGRAIQARFAWSEADKLGVMEMSETAGLRRLRAEERDPTRASTFGVGEMMLAAAKRGAQQIIIGLGGSATNDGGFGMARALGYRFYDAAANELVDGPADLLRLEKITAPESCRFRQSPSLLMWPILCWAHAVRLEPSRGKKARRQSKSSFSKKP